MKKIRQIFMLLLLAKFLVSSTAYAQMTSSEIDQLVEEALRKFDVAGAAVGNGKPGPKFRQLHQLYQQYKATHMRGEVS